MKQDSELYIVNLKDGTLIPFNQPIKKDLPFDSLATEWLRWKHGKGKTDKTWRTYSTFMDRAIAFFGSRDVHTICPADIEAFLDTLTTMGNKSKANVLTALKSFWTWMRKQGHITAADRPEFPVIKFKLGRRKTVDKETQAAIIDEVERIDAARKVWLGIKWLATYPALRPGDLPRIRECDIDVGRGLLNVRDSKNSDPFEIPLIEEDVRLLKEIGHDSSDAPFFRHTSGEMYNEKLWYRYWKRACSNIGVDGVDLYGGTRHSTVRAMRTSYSPEQIKLASRHRTNKAFDRYFELDDEDLREMYNSNHPNKERRNHE